MSKEEIILVCDFFENQYVGGAELTTSAITESGEDYKINPINSHKITIDFVEKNKNKKWIIGNFVNLDLHFNRKRMQL